MERAEIRTLAISRSDVERAVTVAEVVDIVETANRAMGQGETGCALADPSGGASLALTYAVSAPDGDWTFEVVVGQSLYAERRTRDDDGLSYVIGEDVRGAFVRVGDAPARAAALPP